MPTKTNDSDWKVQKWISGEAWEPWEITFELTPQEIELWTTFYPHIMFYNRRMSRKRFHKLLMGCGWSRDIANKIVHNYHVCGFPYREAWEDCQMFMAPGFRVADGPRQGAKD